MNINKAKKAFTLTEALISLAIIGVIAAVTVPVLFNYLENKHFKVMWKSEYADLCQILMQMKSENNNSLEPYISVSGSLIKNVSAYIGLIRTLSYPEAIYGENTTPAFNYIDLSGQKMNYELFDDGQMILSNGVFIAFENMATNTSAILWVDTNGYIKGPNMLGKDLFGIHILEDKIIPLGSDYSVAHNSCNKNPITVSPVGNTHNSPFAGASCSTDYLFE